MKKLLLLLILFLSLHKTAFAAFGDIVQEAVNDSPSSSNVNATFAGSPTAGNLIVVTCFAGDDTDLVVAGTLLEAVENADTTNSDSTAIGYRVVQAADGTTWGFTQNTADQHATIIREFEGPWRPSPLDKTGTTAYTNTVTTQAVTASGTTSKNNELVVAAWGYRVTGGGGDTDTISSVNNSFTNIQNETQGSGTASYKAVGTAIRVLTSTSTPSVTATWSGDGVSRSGATMATFQKALITVRASGTGNATGSSGTAISITKPTGVTSGDVVIAFVYANNPATSIVDNNGANSFTTIGSLRNETGVFVGLVAYRVAGGSEPASYAWTSNSSGAWGVVIATYTGVNTTTVEDTTSTYNFNVDPSSVSDCDSLTTATDGAFSLVMGTVDSSTSALSAGPGNGYTQRVINTANRDLIIFDKEIAPAGATGNQTITWTLSDDTAGYQVALRPSEGGAAPAARRRTATIT